MPYPRTSKDVFNQAAGAKATKDRFLATARLIKADHTYIFDIEDCPAIAMNTGVLAGLGETETKILTRKDFFAERSSEYQDVHQLVSGTYLWVNDKLAVLQRNGNVAASGLLTNPSGVCDEIPSRVMDDELVEESSLTWVSNGVLTVPVLHNLADSKAEIERKVTLKSQQRETFEKIVFHKGIHVDSINFEPVAITPRTQDYASPNFFPVEIRCGNIVCDSIEIPVHVHFTPEWNAWNFHKSCAVTIPDNVDLVMVDGEGFGRPALLKAPEELAQGGSNVLGFLRDYARDVIQGGMRP